MKTEDKHHDPDASISNHSATVRPIETASWEKCSSVISVDADRCPKCGFEPTASAGVRFLGGCSLFTLAVGTPLAFLITLLTLVGGQWLGALVSLVIFVPPLGVSAVIIWGWHRQNTQKPTNTGLLR